MSVLRVSLLLAVLALTCSCAAVQAQESPDASLLSKRSSVSASATATLSSGSWLHGSASSLSELDQSASSAVSSAALQPDDGRHGLDTTAPRAHYATLWLSNTWRRSRDYCARAAGGVLCPAASLCTRGAGHAPVAHKELPSLRQAYSPVSDAENSWVLLSTESAAAKGDRCTVVQSPEWGKTRKTMGQLGGSDNDNYSKSIVACCDKQGKIIKSFLRPDAKRPGDGRKRKHKGKGKRKHKKSKRDCTKIGTGYPSAGDKICCPRGMTRYGDGSACKADGRTSCALWGNYGLKRCSKKPECTVVWSDYADAKKGTKLCCPKGMARYGDGSACRLEGRTTCALWSNDSLPRCSDDGRECTKIGTGYPSAGSKICCPKGMRRYGDGSACKADGRTSCALWGNYGLKRCSKKPECTIVWSDYADAKKGTKLCCPKGMARYGDGSACRLDGRTTCALWSNDSLPRCSDDGRECTKVGSGYPSAGSKICCPKGMRRYGDGSACKADGRTSCALWGNYGLERCRPKAECTLVWPGYPESGDKLCCPKGMSRYGDGSACRRDGRRNCALWSNDSLPRCGTRRSGGSDRVHLSFQFNSRDFTRSYATFPLRISNPNDKSNNLILPYLFGSNASPSKAGSMGLYAHGPLMRTYTAESAVMQAGKTYAVDVLYRPLKGTTQFVITDADTGATVASQTRAQSKALTPAEWTRVKTSDWAVVIGNTEWYNARGGRAHGAYQGTVSNIKATINGKKLPIVKK